MALILLPIVLILAQSLVSIDLKAEQKAYVALNDSLASAEGLALSEAERETQFAEGIAGLSKLNPDGRPVMWVQLVVFLGHPITALLLTTLLTLYLLGTLRGVPKAKLMDLATQALGPAGIIILVTGAGGVFKAILVDSGVGDALAQVFSGLDAPLIFLAFLLTVIIRVTQGSATVAMIGGSALMAKAVEAAVLAEEMSRHDVALTGIAIACGATMASHVNDSGFWVVKNYLGMTEKQCLSTWSVITCIISVIGFLLAWMLSMFV